MSVQQWNKKRVDACLDTFQNPTQFTCKRIHFGSRYTRHTYRDLEMFVNKGAFHELGDLHRSAIIDSSLIDMYVPFSLERHILERQHVRMCLKQEARVRNITMQEEQNKDVVDSLSYWSQDTQLLYSTTGCNRVVIKMDLFQEEVEEEKGAVIEDKNMY